MLTEQRVLAVLSMCALVALALLGGVERRPPDPADLVDRSGFSVDRALADLEWIAKAAHPMGSVPNREVRERLEQELAAIGLEIRVDRGFVAPHGASPERCAVDWVENVVARLPGKDGSRALLIASHYDSAGTGPGAGDDGAAVAAMLEVARVLRAKAVANGPFVNDVVFLFTDGEEIGLLGARHHVAAGSWREKTAAVLNFEARGASGPSILFETSVGNARLVSNYADVVRNPVASSLAYEVYRRMPNDTDFTIFKRAGWRGLNFAFIGSHERYHTADDSIENLDPRSLAHHGSTMLSLAERLADSDLGPIAVDERTSVYFGVLGAFTVTYPIAVQYLLDALALAAVVIGIRIGWRRERIGRASLVSGVLAQLVALVLACAASAILTRLVTGVDDSDRLRFFRVVVDGPRHLPAHLLLAISIVCMTFLQLRSRTGADGAYAGALVVWSVVLCAAAVISPAGSYAVSWPLLGIAAGFVAFVTRPRKGRIGGLRFLALVAATVPTGLLVVPLLYFAAQALTFSAAPITTAAFVVALSSATPLLLCAMAVSRLLIPIATSSVAWVILGLAIWNGSFATEDPRSDRVEYVVDGAMAVGAFASSDTDELRAMFPGTVLTEVDAEELVPGAGKAKRGRVAAEVHPITEATFELMNATLDERIRVCEFRMRVPAGASSVRVTIAKESRAWIESVDVFAPDAEALAARSVAACGDDPERWSSCELRIRGVPHDVVVVKIGQPIAVPLVATIVTRIYGLPELPPGSSPPRPWRIPARWAADESVIHRTSTF